MARVVCALRAVQLRAPHAAVVGARRGPARYPSGRQRTVRVRAHGAGSFDEGEFEELFNRKPGDNTTNKARKQPKSFDETKPKSIDELLEEKDSDRNFWENGSSLPDLSQPARNVAAWLKGVPGEEAASTRPQWAWWPIDEENLTEPQLQDSSLNLGLVSPGGSTVARLMTQEEWIRHRNPWRYFRVLASLVRGRSTVLWRTILNMLCLSLYTAAICAFNTRFPQWAMQCNALPFSMMSAFISLLLVFRTNASYGRFLEARLLLGQLVLFTREFARMAVIHFPSYALRKRAMAYTSAFAWCLKGRVRYRDNPEPIINQLLGERETRALLTKSKPAFFALQELTKMVASCEDSLPTYVALGMNQQLSSMDAVLGGLHESASRVSGGLVLQALHDLIKLGVAPSSFFTKPQSTCRCERLLSTPIPLSYTRHTTRCIMLYLLGLPFALWPLMAWGTVPTALVIMFVIMGIEEVGNHIEEPFAIMPIMPLCQIVTATCRETLEYYGTPPPAFPEYGIFE